MLVSTLRISRFRNPLLGELPNAGTSGVLPSTYSGGELLKCGKVSSSSRSRSLAEPCGGVQKSGELLLLRGLLLGA